MSSDIMQHLAESGAREVTARLASLEREIDEDRYRPGLWQPLLGSAGSAALEIREALARG